MWKRGKKKITIWEKMSRWKIRIAAVKIMNEGSFAERKYNQSKMLMTIKSASAIRAGCFDSLDLD